MVEIPEGKITFRRPSLTWDNNIKIDSKETTYEGTDWIYMAQDRGLFVMMLISALVSIKTVSYFGYVKVLFGF